jgi:hypothetical protein
VTRQAALLLMLGCRGDLLPGEIVLGDELAAVTVSGSAGSELGAAVAVGPEGEVAVGAPGAGQVRVLDADGSELWRAEGVEGLGRRLAWTDEGLLAWAPGAGVYRLEEGAEPAVWQATTAPVVAMCNNGEVLERPSTDEDVACDSDLGAVVWTDCDAQGCVAYTRGGEEGKLVELGNSSPGSAVGFDQGLPCWGDAVVGGDIEPGRVSCLDGPEVDGLEGDHLGVAIGAGRAIGVFNKWIVPARARLVPLDGGQTWVVDRAAETSVLSADRGASGLVAVGVPGFGAQEAQEGRVYLFVDPTWTP